MTMPNSDAQLQADLRRVLLPLDQATSLPRRAYVDPHLAAIESQRLSPRRAGGQGAQVAGGVVAGGAAGGVAGRGAGELGVRGRGAGPYAEMIAQVFAGPASPRSRSSSSNVPT